ncbi:hypothetical protein [Selenomonas sp. ND2010]|uniref:hypothetical protein n=1 Tax=Selenomonas sp. ND2010 TaxID=1410618 RepID=UPI00051AF346|nr:hypothetical protein [Selenomonas sp. ND2010]
MTFYRKYLLIFTVSVLAGLLFHGLLFWVNFGVPMEQERYMHEWLAKKDVYASSIQGKKIVFISGSNTLLGVDTERIEQELGIPTVNYSANATMRFYTLERAKKHLKSNDIVILPLEFPYYTWHHDVFEPEEAFYYLGYDPSIIQALSFYDKLKFISQLNTKDLLKFTYQRIRPPARVEGAYSSQYLNKNGDMTNNYKMNRLSNSALRSKINKVVFDDTPLSNDAQQKLKQFITYCHNNNITVYASWPNYLWNKSEFSETDLAGIRSIEEFYCSQGVEVLGSYTDCLYDIDMFYDTNYHLNDEGKRIHTDYIIDMLKRKQL